MAEKKKRKQKLQALAEPTKEEMKIAKFIRFNAPKKTTVCQKMNLEYFVGSKAVDTLMTSKWSKGSKKSDVNFQTRSDAVKFLQLLLSNNMMYRAKRVLKEPKTSKDSNKSGKAEDKDQSNKSEDSDKVRKRKKGKDVEKKKDEDVKTEEKSEKKKRKKYKLDLHEEQVFLDSSDLYVWIYDPVSAKKMFLGAIAVLGIIGVTLFPLWPPSVRVGVYYLSVCGGVFIGAILVTALCRSIMFALIWGITMGKHHFWFLPNLLADVGFFDSFKPVYTHEVVEKKKVKDKNSDSEDEEEIPATPQDGADEEKKPPLEGEIVSKDEDAADDKSSNETPPPEGDKVSGDDDKESGSDYEVIDAKSNEQ